MMDQDYKPAARLPAGTYTWEQMKAREKGENTLIEPWGALGHMAIYEGAVGNEEQRSALEELRQSARTGTWACLVAQANADGKT